MPLHTERPASGTRAATSTATAPTPGHRALTAKAAVGALVAVALAAILVLGAGSDVYAVLGYRDPGAVTKLGATLLRLVFDVAGAACVGSLVFCALFTRPQRSGLVSADGYAALRLAGATAWTWFAASVLVAVFDTADSAGQPVSQVLDPQAFLGLLQAVDAPKAWLLSAVLALTVAVSSRFVLRWRASLGLGAVAVLALLPPVFVSHSASNAGHDLATNSMVVHVVAASVWLGTLFAVALHARRGGRHVTRVSERYRRLATGCWLVLAVSGVIDALILLGPAGLLTTGFGALVLAKAGCLLALGVVGAVMRRRAARDDDPHRGLLRLTGAELTIMLATVGVSMGMAHVPPPNLLDRDTTVTEVVLGYNLPGAPSPITLLTTWRLDLLLGVTALALATLYLAGVLRLRRQGESWPVARTASWLGGCATLLVATSSGIALYAPTAFGIHMVAHVLLNMLGPALLVLGGPVSLAMRALPTAPSSDPYGPREWLLAVVHSRAARVLTHPVVSSLLLAGSLYALYLTGLFGVVMAEHWAHEVMDVYFLVTGYLWFWTMLGTDEAPRRTPQLARLAATLGLMPLLAFFGVLVLSMDAPIAGMYYRTLDLPWAPDLLAAQQVGGVVGWLGGEIPMLLVLVVVLWQWNRAERSGGAHGDDPDYAAMLETLSRSRGT